MGGCWWCWLRGSCRPTDEDDFADPPLAAALPRPPPPPPPPPPRDDEAVDGDEEPEDDDDDWEGVALASVPGAGAMVAAVRVFGCNWPPDSEAMQLCTSSNDQ